MIIVALTVAFIAAAILVYLYGKSFVTSQIEQNLQRKVSLSSIRLGFPLNITLKELEIKDLFKARQVSFSLNPLGFLAGKIVLGGLTVDEPVINLIQFPDGSLNLPQFKTGAKQPPVFLTGLKVKNGKINFLDRKIVPDGFLIKLENVNLDIAKVMFPLTSLKTKFNLGVSVIGQDAQNLGALNGLGWIDFGKKDMDVLLEIKNLEAVYFSPYYGDFLSQKKLLSVKLDLKCQLKAVNNDLNILSNLNLSRLVYAPQEPAQEGEPPSLELVKSALDLFTDRDGNLNLEFAIKTKLDNPQISIKQLKKVILKSALKNLSNQPPGDLIEKISNTVEQFKDFGKQMEKIFKNKE